jgi:hypothetical protein
MSCLEICGITIGTHDGWDQSGDTSFCFYDFKSEISNLKDVDCLDFDWKTGSLKGLDSEGDIVWSCTILSVLHNEIVNSIMQ